MGESVSNGDRVLQDEEFWGFVRSATISSAQVLESNISGETCKLCQEVTNTFLKCYPTKGECFRLISTTLREH